MTSSEQAAASRAMLTCRICATRVPKLIRCHLYPDGITKQGGGGRRELIGLSIRGNRPRAQHAPIGIFDDHIVCANCEVSFGPPDDAAIRFRKRVLELTGEFEFPAVESGLSTVLPIFRVDPAPLHAFAMACLYRAFLSTRWEIGEVRNQWIEDEVKPFILEGRQTIYSGRHVAYMFTRSDLASITVGPRLMPRPDFPAYYMQMPNLGIWVAASNAGLPPGLDTLRLTPGDRVTVYRRRRPERYELDDFAKVCQETWSEVARATKKWRTRSWG